MLKINETCFLWGFSFLEFFIVLFIVAALILAVFPNFQRIVLKVKTEKASTDLKAIAYRINSYMVDKKISHCSELFKQDEQGGAEQMMRSQVLMKRNVRIQIPQVDLVRGTDVFVENSKYKFISIQDGNHTGYYLISAGPDQTYDLFLSKSADLTHLQYDPSNGVFSCGDIIHCISKN